MTETDMRDMSKTEIEPAEEYKLYVSSKIVKAVPEAKPIKPDIDDGRECEYAQGYKVVYPDGYVSWCPKDTFELYNREMPQAEERMVYWTILDGEKKYTVDATHGCSAGSLTCNNCDSVT